MELPAIGDIHRHRESQVVENLKIWLGRGRYKRELEMVQELIEAGHDPLNIAAAAIKIARADEKQRPIAEIADVKMDMTRKPERDFSRGARRDASGRRDMPVRAGGSKRRGDSSHEEGMVRLKLNKGKLNGIRPSDIVGTIAFHANIPGFSIGKIRIEEKHSFVDIPEELLDQVMQHNGNYRAGKEKFSLQKAN